MKKITIIFAILFCNYAHSQVIDNLNTATPEIINPKGQWFFGAEIGVNTITSIKPDHTNSLQGGILAEYYFAKHWSVDARLKYFTTGVSNKFDYKKGVFMGAVIALPININWDYRIYKNLSGTLKAGISLNQEVKSDYYYPASESTDFSTFYASFNPGFGLNYFISPSTAIYLNYEVYVLGSDRDNADWLQILPNSPNNNLFNVGIKYNFRKFDSSK